MTILHIFTIDKSSSDKVWLISSMGIYSPSAGGQPLVQPNGTVIVPIQSFTRTAATIAAFKSTNGGLSWSGSVTVAVVRSRAESGGLRSGTLPSADVDGSGNVYVVWADCRFESSCSNWHGCHNQTWA